MRTRDKHPTAVVTWMTAIMAGLICLGLPLGYFGLSYSFLDSALQTEAEINARIVTGLINDNPAMWRFEELRLVELLKRRPGAWTPEARRIRVLDGTVVAENAEDLQPPLHTRRAELLDSGRTVGTIEISRSLRPLIRNTGLVALLGALIGASGFVVLRTVPLRMLDRAVTSLFEEKERSHVTLRSIGDGVITTGADGRVLLLNGVAETLTAWTQDEARGRRLDEVFRIVNENTREPFENPVDGVLREGRTSDRSQDAVLIAQDGKERLIAESSAPIRGEDGSITGVVIVFRDITDRKRHREEMQRADKLESVGLLAGGIAHNFNNFLTTILGNISLAQISPRCDDDLRDLLSRSENACLRAKGLTLQLLTFAKGGAPVKETVSLPELIRDSAGFALTGSNVRADVRLSGDLPPVSIDGGQINQVINNLVINAKEAMPAGGVVTIEAEQVQVGGELPYLTPGNYVLVSVRDGGPGIPKEILPRIFDPYFTTKKSGSGLGLATCYSIIRRHDGHIEASSGPGEGAIFRFYLPVLHASVAPGPQGRADGILFGTGKVLVMDDEEIIRSTAQQMLIRLGYEVVLAADGAQAIERYHEARASGRPIDVLILDLTVPGGMGGEEAMRTLIETAPGVKAVVSSGYSDDPVLGDFRSFGFSGVISKPYDLKELSRVMHRVLGKD